MEHRRQTTAGLHPTDLHDGVVPDRLHSSRLSLLTLLFLCVLALLGLAASAWVIMVDGAAFGIPFIIAVFLLATANGVGSPGTDQLVDSRRRL